MSHDPDEPSELKALFERSAQSLDPAARARLRARARAIPPQKPGLLQFPSLWAWASALGALGAAAAVLLSLNGPHSIQRSTSDPLPAALGNAASASPSAQTVDTESVGTDEADELAGGADLDDAMSPDVLDDLALDPGDLAEAEVDAWISAAGATLGG
ncbi:MAG TPA: hypothetical protein VG937_03945 [Polyangiaceae bacterium]|nr:hypothetical protein [Polyangiaceae bacterium]